MFDPRANAVASLSDILQGDLNSCDRCCRTLTYACTILTADLGVLALNRSYHCDSASFTFGFAPHDWNAPRFSFARALTFDTLSHPAAILTSDAQPYYQQDIALSIGLYSILCAPVLRRRRALGAFCLQRRLTNAPYSSDDLEILEGIARAAARLL